MSALRFVTSGQLAICIILFFLPWIEIQCPVPDLANVQFQMPKQGEPEPKVAAKELRYTPFLTQTGFQAATGEYKITDTTLREMMNQAKKAGPDAETEKEVKKAPLLWIFPMAALAGIVLGLAVPGGPVQKLLLVTCCALVLASGVGQAAIGFPVEQDIKEQQKKQDKQAAAGFEGEGLKTVYKPGFYLAAVCALGALMTAVLAPASAVGNAKYQRHRIDSSEDSPAFDVPTGPDAGRDDSRKKGPNSPFENLG